MEEKDRDKICMNLVFLSGIHKGGAFVTYFSHHDSLVIVYLNHGLVGPLRVTILWETLAAPCEHTCLPIENTTWNPELERCLVQNYVFSSRMLEDIKKSPDAVTTLYHKACKRGPKAFEGLVKSLAQVMR